MARIGKILFEDGDWEMAVYTDSGCYLGHHHKEGPLTLVDTKEFRCFYCNTLAPEEVVTKFKEVKREYRGYIE
jgi:hypothetical protein